MKTLRILYHLARADFLERVRRYSFLLMLAGTIYLGFAINQGDFYLELDGYRGVLNSAWVGGMVTVSTAFLLTLFGFYLVKNTIERDIQTGVGQIIATTPISRLVYLIGKWLSNWAVFIALLIILALAAVLMQLMGGESSRLNLWQLLAPFLLLSLPTMALVAAIALLFETIPWLRGGFGNIVYFAVWLFAFIAALEAKLIWLDWSGTLIVWQSMGAALKEVFPAYSNGFNITGQALPDGGLKTYDWQGIQWTAEILLSRLTWLVASLGLVLAGSLFFHRFDPSYEKVKAAKKSAVKVTPVTTEEKSASGFSAEAPAPVRLGSLETSARGFNFGNIMRAELRLLLKGLPWWWYVVFAGLILAPFFNSLEVVRQGLLPVAWIWPVLVWSGMGCREARFATRQIVFSAAHPIAYQIPAAWLAGVLVTALAGSGVALRLLAGGEVAGLLGWLGGVIFIPSLALAFGVWSGTSKVFEVVYVLWWYLGPLHPLEMPKLDFMGFADLNYWILYVIAGLGLIALAAIGRKRQIYS